MPDHDHDDDGPRCERCSRQASEGEVYDYCAACWRVLCPACGADGCCGATPVRSGLRADAIEADDTTP